MYQQKIMVRQGAYHTSKFGDQFIKVSVSAPREWVEKFCELLPDSGGGGKLTRQGDTAFLIAPMNVDILKISKPNSTSTGPEMTKRQDLWTLN